MNLELEQIAKEIVAQTKATDEAEDAQFGEARGDELPEELRTLEGRRQFLRRARRSLRRDEEGERPERIEAPDVEAETDVEGETEVEAELEAPDVETEEPERTPTRSSSSTRSGSPTRVVVDAGGCLRPSVSSSSIAGRTRIHVRSRVERLLLALRRLEADLSAERAGNEAYEAYRKQGRIRDGRRLGRPADPYQPAEVSEGKVTDRPGLTSHPGRVRVRAGI